MNIHGSTFFWPFCFNAFFLKQIIMKRGSYNYGYLCLLEHTTKYKALCIHYIHRLYRKCLFCSPSSHCLPFSPSWSHRLFLYARRWKSPHDSFLKPSVSPNERGGTVAPPQPASRCRQCGAGSGNKAWDPGAAPRGQRGDISVSVLWRYREACVSGGLSRALWSAFFSLKRNPDSCSG